MPQVVQVKRRIGPGAVGGPATLAAGELAFNSNGQALYVGSDAGGTVTPLVSTARQLEIHTAGGNQNIVAGNKTWVAPALLTVPVANLKVPGGNASEMVITDGLGNLSFAPSTKAAQQFVGSLDAAAGSITFTTASGAPGPGLPAAAAANNGWYIIADTAGATVPANVPPGTYNIGDWVISNGTAWTHLNFGGIETDLASEVGVAPAVAGGSNVQAALEGLAAADTAFVVGPAASVVDNIATYSNVTGHLIKDSGILVTSLATVAYVDSENTAQDLIIAANAAFVAAQPAIDAGQTAAINDKVAGPTPAAAVADNIAVWDLATGRLVKDGGQSIQDIKDYVDTQIALIPGGLPPAVTAPELVGNGTPGSEITFTGITTQAVQAGALGPTFTGNGLSTNPLVLALVDGGVY